MARAHQSFHLGFPVLAHEDGSAVAVFRISHAEELATGSGQMTNSDALAVFGFSDAQELAKGSGRMATSSASDVLPLQDASIVSKSVSFILGSQSR